MIRVNLNSSTLAFVLVVNVHGPRPATGTPTSFLPTLLLAHPASLVAFNSLRNFVISTVFFGKFENLCFCFHVRMFWSESRDVGISLCLSHKKREARQQESITPYIPIEIYRSYIHRSSFIDWEFYRAGQKLVIVGQVNFIADGFPYRREFLHTIW